MGNSFLEIGNLYKVARCKYLVDGQVYIDAHKMQWQHSSHCPSGNSGALRKSLCLCTARIWAGHLGVSLYTFANVAYFQHVHASSFSQQLLSFVYVSNSEWKRPSVDSRNESEGKRERNWPWSSITYQSSHIHYLVYPEIPCSGCYQVHFKDEKTDIHQG